MKKEVIIGILAITVIVVAGCTQIQQSPKKLDPHNYPGCITPTDGMIITQNTVFCPGEYVLPNGISIGANNIFLDCDNTTLRQGNPYGNQIDGISLIGISSTTVKNCNLFDYKRGVYLESAMDNIIQNIYSDSVIEGIVLSLSTNNLITNNSFYVVGPAFRIENSPSNTLINNLDRGALAGEIEDSDNLIVNNNDFGPTGGGGGGQFAIRTSSFVNLSSNSIPSLSLSGLQDSTFIHNDFGSLSFSESRDLEFSENHFTVQFNLGFIGPDSTNIFFKNNNFTIMTGDFGPYLDNLLFENNTFSFTDFYLGNYQDVEESSDITFFDNRFTGMFLVVGPYTQNSLFQNNTIRVVVFILESPSSVLDNEIELQTFGRFEIDSGMLVQSNNITREVLTEIIPDGLIIGGNNNEIRENIIFDLSTGITIIGNNNTLIDNMVFDGEKGIVLQNSRNNFLRENDFYSNTYNFLIEGSEDSYFIHDIDTSNLVDSKPVYYLVNVSNQIYDSINAGFFACILCNNIEVRNIEVQHLGDGILFWRTSNSVIQDVLTSNSMRGIRLERSYDNEIYSVTEENNLAGIYLVNSDRNTIQGINAYQNNYGIFLNSSDENNVKDTYIINGNLSGVYLLDSRANNMSNITSVMNLQNGIHFESSSENKLTDSSPIMNTEYGISLRESSYNLILGNTVEYNGWKRGLIGANIFLEGGSGYNLIESNMLRDDSINHTVGIIVNSDNNRIFRNEIVTNAEGVTVGGNNNQIWYNNFIQSVFQASDFGSNSWDDGSLGNYWSDFDESSEGCNDINGDDICDSGRDIAGGSNIDNFPSILELDI